MAQNIYYSNPSNEKIGKIGIGLPVFNFIVENTINDFNGFKLFGKNAITSELNGTDLEVSVNVKADYGTSISNLSKEAQEKIVTEIFNTTNVKVKVVNVNIMAIEF